MSKDDVAKAVLGQLPAALAETVSLATPLTMSRIEGRDETSPARDGPSPSGSASRSSPPTTTSGPSSRSSAVARGEVGLFLALTKGSEGTYSAVDLYARPWPFVKLVRDHLAVSDERFRDSVDLSVPYVAAGPPGGFRTEPPSLPGLSADVAFHSPVLTATATGGELVSVILKAVGEISGAPTFRVVSRFGEAYVVVFDATVHGHTWQLAGVYGLDEAGKIADMRLYSRPWPVTAFFRGEAYKLMRDQFGPEYWQGENPLVALGEV